MRHAAWIVVACMVTACRGASSTPAKEAKVITFDVKSTTDLQQLVPEYTKLARSGFAGRVEIRIASGAAIGRTSWNLEPELGASRDVPIDVVIHGGGGSLPLFGSIVARSLRLDDVALTDNGQGHVWVTRDFTMHRVMLADCRRVNSKAGVGSPGQSVIEVNANGAAVNVTIEDSWFVRNFQDEQPDFMLRLTRQGERAGGYGAVRVVRSAFLGNAFAADLSVEHARRVEIEDSVFYRNWVGDGSELACEHCDDVVVNRSSFVLERMDQLATHPVRLEDSRVIAEHAAFQGHAEIGTTITTLAAKPLRVPAPDTWTRVRAAFAH